MRVHSFVSKPGQKGEAARSLSCGKLGFPGSGKTDSLGRLSLLGCPNQWLCQALHDSVPTFHFWPDQGSEEQASNDNSQNSKMRGSFSLLGWRVPHAWGLGHTAHLPPCRPFVVGPLLSICSPFKPTLKP